MRQCSIRNQAYKFFITLKFIKSAVPLSCRCVARHKSFTKTNLSTPRPTEGNTYSEKMFLDRLLELLFICYNDFFFYFVVYNDIGFDIKTNKLPTSRFCYRKPLLFSSGNRLIASYSLIYAEEVSKKGYFHY